MSDKYLVQPDLAYINELEMLGADTLKKCFQCATCSVACPIAPENSPVPQERDDRSILGVEGQAGLQR